MSSSEAKRAQAGINVVVRDCLQEQKLGLNEVPQARRVAGLNDIRAAEWLFYWRKSPCNHVGGVRQFSTASVGESEGQLFGEPMLL